MSWNDFNSAEDQGDVIPAGTIAKVRLSIRKGNFDDPNLGWTGGYATRNPETGSCYLDCEYVVLEGQYAKRRVWSLIGLHSAKGETYAKMGRSLIKAILNSSRNISPKDKSPQAQEARKISGFADLDGIEFLARIDVEENDRGPQNKINRAITPDHKDYAAYTNGGGASGGQGGGTPPAPSGSMGAPSAPQAPSAPSAPANQAAPSNRPSWAQ